MPSPRERLEKIIAARTPSEVIFKPTRITDNVIFFSAVKTKEATVNALDEDTDLQDALSKEVEEKWDWDKGCYVVWANVEQLWDSIKRTILREYECVSKRCTATKRKTEDFIRDVKLEDKHLPNYLIQVFLKVRSPTYDDLTRQEQQDLFEQFESLRRTYGKRR